jgi:hypothetical protein
MVKLLIKNKGAINVFLGQTSTVGSHYSFTRDLLFRGDETGKVGCYPP